MKKFYKLVSIEPASNGFVIELDGKPVKMPGGSPLVPPTEKLAIAIAAEWTAQGDDIIPDSMPLTQILTTALDQVSRERLVMTEKLLSYMNTDLLCYRADQPEDMARRQEECWNPWLNWFEKNHEVVLETTTGLSALKQPVEAREKTSAAIAAMDDMAFTILQLTAVLTGSLVLALAFVAREASAEQLYNAANVEENHKAEIYNEAEHGGAPLQEKAQQAMLRDLDAAGVFLDLSYN